MMREIVKEQEGEAGMTDLEKVTKGLEHCTTALGCFECPYSVLDKATVDCKLLIDRDALDLLKEQKPLCVSISNMKWVSVNDAKPKSMANKVLVWLEHDDLAGYIGYGHYEKYKGEEMWFDLEYANGEQFIKRGYRVTHWMPLPEPPKGGK